MFYALPPAAMGLGMIGARIYGADASVARHAELGLNILNPAWRFAGGELSLPMVALVMIPLAWKLVATRPEWSA